MNARRIVAVALLMVVCVCAAQTARAAEPPVIKKLGTVDCDMVETTPIVFQEKLYRFEYVRDNYKPNTSGKAYFRFRDSSTGDVTPAFAEGHHLGCAFVDHDTMYVFGVPKWGASTVQVFWSKDLKKWENKEALNLAGWEIFNTSVCKTPDCFVMAFEIGAPPEETGNAFTMRFAASKDLKTWGVTPKECVYTKERYSACPALRWQDGLYYMVYLEAYDGFYAPNIVRSRNLIQWEESPFKPIMKHSDEDKKIANPKLTDQEKERIAKAENLNNSDVDFCEFEGKTIITYSWGNQKGIEFLAEAVYAGKEKDFLRAFFPK